MPNMDNTMMIPLQPLNYSISMAVATASSHNPPSVETQQNVDTLPRWDNNASPTSSHNNTPREIDNNNNTCNNMKKRILAKVVVLPFPTKETVTKALAVAIAFLLFFGLINESQQQHQPPGYRFIWLGDTWHLLCLYGIGFMGQAVVFRLVGADRYGSIGYWYLGFFVLTGIAVGMPTLKLVLPGLFYGMGGGGHGGL